MIWTCVGLVGFANIGWNGVYMALVAESAPLGRIGRASGSALRTVFAGAVVVPPALGLVADRAGWKAAWLAACVLASLAAVAIGIAALAQRDNARSQRLL